MKTLVTLEWYELQCAAGVGIARQTFALKEGAEHKYGYNPDVVGEWWTHELAAQSEMAVAKALGVYWPASICAAKSDPDVGYNVQVRQLPSKNARLVIRDNDRSDHIYVSVLPHDRVRGVFTQTFEIMGWVWGADKELGERAAPHGRPPAYFFTLSQLHPFHSIPVMSRWNITIPSGENSVAKPSDDVAIVFG